LLMKAHLKKGEAPPPSYRGSVRRALLDTADNIANILMPLVVVCCICGEFLSKTDYADCFIPPCGHVSHKKCIKNVEADPENEGFTDLKCSEDECKMVIPTNLLRQHSEEADRRQSQPQNEQSLAPEEETPKKKKKGKGASKDKGTSLTAQNIRELCLLSGIVPDSVIARLQDERKQHTDTASYVSALTAQPVEKKEVCICCSRSASHSLRFSSLCWSG